MSIEITTEEVPEDYIIFPLVRNIPTTVTLYLIGACEYKSEGLPIEFYICGNFYSISLMSLEYVRYTNAVKPSHFTIAINYFEAEYKKYRNHLYRIKMDNYPIYRLLENLVISGGINGTFRQGIYSAKLSVYRGEWSIIILNGENTIYTDEIVDDDTTPRVFLKGLIKKFTDRALPEKLYGLSTSTKSAIKNY
jgi:hypothetical protein